MLDLVLRQESVAYVSRLAASVHARFDLLGESRVTPSTPTQRAEGLYLL